MPETSSDPTAIDKQMAVDESIILIPPHAIPGVWPDVEEGMDQVCEQIENEIRPEWIRECLENEQMFLHVMVNDDSDPVAFMVTQRLATGTGYWLDMVVGYSIDNEVSTFMRFVRFMENVASEAGFTGLKFVTTQDQLIRVMCDRMGYRSRFVEVLKEV